MVVATSTADAFFYGRVSTEAQAGDQHASLDTQEARALEYCASHGLRLVASFVDVQSGRRDDRTEYRQMVERALAGGASVIVVQFLDRFGATPVRSSVGTGTSKSGACGSLPPTRTSARS